MIAPHCFQPDWIRSRRELLGGGDPILIEKTIHAFALLDQLAQTGLPFVFKGGTSLLLRLERLRRLSIDIDIMCPVPNTELDAVLRRVSQQVPFLRHEEDVRGMDRLPQRRHFRFHYRSALDPGQRAAHVLLDVVQEEAPHPGIERLSMRTSLIELEQDTHVRIPTAASLLGDKLTAFAPNTVGVACRVESAMQVMKQLFDVAELFQVVGDFDEVGRAYDAVFAKENGYRESLHTREGALEDSIDTARRLSYLHMRRAPAPHPQAIILEDGRRQLTSHLLGGRFADEEMKVAAARVACLASALLHNRLDLLVPAWRFDLQGIEVLRDQRLRDSVLNRMKGARPEAFYYWSLVEQMQGRDDEA
jgi:hypothetical protein